MIPTFPPRKLNPASLAPRFIPQYRPNVPKPADSSQTPTTVSASSSVAESARPVLPPPAFAPQSQQPKSIEPSVRLPLNNQSAPVVEASTQPMILPQSSVPPRLHETQPITASTEVLEDDIDPSLFFGPSSTDGPNKRQKLSHAPAKGNDKGFKPSKQKIELTSSLPAEEEEKETLPPAVISKVGKKSNERPTDSSVAAENLRTKKILLPNQPIHPEKPSNSSSSTSGTGSKRKSSSALVKKQNTPLFPMGYLQLIHYPLLPASTSSEDSAALNIREKKIVTYLKLSPKGIPGIQFTNIDNRAVITAIHPVLYGQSPNGKYDLQVHDMIYSLNHLDAKYATYQQLLDAIHHENQPWDDLPPLLTTSSSSASEGLRPDPNTSSNSHGSSNANHQGSSSSSNSNSNNATVSALMSSNTNIYINDMNDPNYHSNRTLLKNAIIESMANIVFVRVLQ